MEQTTSMEFENKRLIGIVAGVGALLSIPFLVMKLGGDMRWSIFDFIVAGVPLLCTGLAIEFVLRKVQSTAHRLAICAVILFILFIVWVELAVGLIGTPLAGS
jgi:hypothetical protein